MFNVLVKKSADEMYVQLYNGRIILFEDLVRNYERILRGKPATFELRVGERFIIDREVINECKELIYSRCNEAGYEGEWLLKRFESSDKRASDNPKKYPRLIETFIFKCNWEYITKQEAIDMCKNEGYKICDSVICDFELQMRICNGEFVKDLVISPDKLPYQRLVVDLDESVNYLTTYGGGFVNNMNRSPSVIGCSRQGGEAADYRFHQCTPYGFREATSQH